MLAPVIVKSASQIGIAEGSGSYPIHLRIIKRLK